MSDRKTGAGCDQVITIDKNISSDHDVRIEIFNPNGDSAEACGNGTRCVAKLLFNENNITKLRLKSLAGILNYEANVFNNRRLNKDRLSHKSFLPQLMS